MPTTPMMKQYQDAKAACGDAILLFRMGDFYEMFLDDAQTAAKTLNLALTSRDKGENPIPMAGFPHHQLENYLGKLVAAGLRVAICDQTEDAREAKGLVRREVTRIVSAGTLTDAALLDPRESNYLAAIVVGEPSGLAWAELSTGRFHAACFPSRQLADQLARIDPAECLLAEGADLLAATEGRRVVTRRPAWAFGQTAAVQALAKHFGTANLEGFGFDPACDGPALGAAGAILDYLTETQKTSLAHLDRLIPYRVGQTLELDESTRRSLEITRTIRDGRREGSLLAALDRTTTSMGSRTLADWLANPLADLAAIHERSEAIAELVGDARLCDDLRTRLEDIHDLQRLLARVTTGRASPRDLACVGRTLAALPAIKARLTARTSALLNRLESELDLCGEIRARLEAALADDCPLASREGGLIRGGFHAELDTLRDLSAGGKQWMARYQADEIARTGIPSLKVGFNKVFGYYLEVTHTHGHKIPDNYQRKQTVKNAERYVTPELKEHEEKVLTAEERAKELEYELFVALRETTADAAKRLQASAAVLAQLDVLAALAALARQRGYCRPRCVAEPVLRIIDGRHPVLDVLVPEGTFVPNDTICGRELENGRGLSPFPESSEEKGTVPVGAQDRDAGGQIMLITGPNMAGKSTYIRQVALLTLMAQIGSFVPAREAVIGLADRIFARVGAADELARGQSTFMVEMTETARILNLATPRSLVILDEIGRGTSTYDGVSLAWAVVEHLHDRIGCRTLFATHYHELTDLAQSLSGVRNLNVAVREWAEQLVFLHKIVPGAADKSYGIHVARLAGVPKEVNHRAMEILARLEQEHVTSDGRPKLARRPTRRSGELQLTLFAPQEHPLLDRIRELDLNALTPLDAVRLLEGWQTSLVENRPIKPH
ncbi:MAG TPA: DNA mismatch repair protein MutS [Pirellulales bacterium]|jgi:DNA mismatch repair protein MutS|nr:DNA mismatch repair protein MutS [Pirellulales bacterium]